VASLKNKQTNKPIDNSNNIDYHFEEHFFQTSFVKNFLLFRGSLAGNFSRKEPHNQLACT